MFEYTKKSLKLASQSKYLDKLLSIYPVQKAQLRIIPMKTQILVRDAFNKKDKNKLIKAFLNTEKFPVNDPYIASFRHNDFLFKDNPLNINRIGSRLFFYEKSDDLIKMASEPKTPSRQFGNAFKKWLHTLGFSFLKEAVFINSTKGAFLSGNEKFLNDFVTKKLKVNPEKRPDFLFKKNKSYYLGEANFISDYGGSQDNQVDKALAIADISTKNVKGIAVLDGIIWFSSNFKMHQKIKNSNNYILSALLLKEFLNKL